MINLSVLIEFEQETWYNFFPFTHLQLQLQPQPLTFNIQPSTEQRFRHQLKRLEGPKPRPGARKETGKKGEKKAVVKKGPFRRVPDSDDDISKGEEPSQDARKTRSRKRRRVLNSAEVEVEVEDKQSPRPPQDDAKTAAQK